jgi:hypothetical protein
MVIGKQAWPMPIPIVKGDKGWYFDVADGADEILARRIGANELATSDNLQAYVDAQVQYASADRDTDDVLEYAQKINSSPGKMDGLYWRFPPDQPKRRARLDRSPLNNQRTCPTANPAIPLWATTTGSSPVRARMHPAAATTM